MKAFLEITQVDNEHVTLLAIDKIVSVHQHGGRTTETRIVMITREQYWVPGTWQDLAKHTRAMF